MKPESRPAARYEILDELRGVAAVIVLIFHIGTRAQAPALTPNGYLAVDFFFMLSGFVMAEAYRERLLQGMPFAEFTARRLARMMPVVFLGICLGTAYALARWIVAPSRSDSLSGIVAAALLNLLLIPKIWQEQASGWEAFPINGPLWSLFFEMVVNLAWAGLLVFRRRTTMIFLAITGATGLAVLAAAHGTVDMGWDVPSMPGGLARVSFGFSVGLLIHSYRDHLPHLGGHAGTASICLLTAALAFPAQDVRWALAITLLGLPAILMLAVSAGPGSGIPGGRFLGRVSYALYGIHVPILALYSGMVETLFGYQRTGFEAYLMAPVIVVIASLVTHVFDRPAQMLLRNLIETRFVSKRRAQPRPLS